MLKTYGLAGDELKSQNSKSKIPRRSQEKKRKKKTPARWDSNPQSLLWKSDALSVALHDQMSGMNEKLKSNTFGSNPSLVEKKRKDKDGLFFLLFLAYSPAVCTRLAT